MHGDLMLTLARHARLPGALLAALFLAACPAPQSEDEATEAAEAEAQAEGPDEESAQDDALPCALTRSTPLIESVRLESDDGACRLFLPHGVTPGTYAIRVSAMGADQAAALERTTDEGTLYATGGSVEITSVEGGVVRGAIRAEDDAEPVTGRIAAAFEVTLPAAE